VTRIIRIPEFYPVWPSMGKQLRWQWDEIRRDTSALAAFMNSVLLEEEDSGYLQDARMSGLEIGEYDQKNKYRIFYDKVLAKFKIQRNDGTLNAPIWIDLLIFDSTSVGSLKKIVEHGGAGTPDVFYPTDYFKVQRPDLTLENDGSGRAIITYNPQLRVDEENTPTPVDVTNVTRIRVNRDRGLSIVQEAAGIPRIEFDAGEYFYFQNDKLRLDADQLFTDFVARPAFLDDTEINNLINTSALLKRNYLINGDFQVWQLGTTINGTNLGQGTIPVQNNDGNYFCDGWVVVSDGNDRVDITKETSVIPTGGYTAAAFNCQSTTQKWGIVQLLKNEDTIALRGQSVSFQFKARIGSGDVCDRIRFALLSWTGSANAETKDVVGASWQSEGTNPDMATNWAYVNAPTIHTTLTTSYQTLSFENITVPSNAVHLAIFIWMDDTSYAAGDIVYISDCKLEVGSEISSYFHNLFIDEIKKCHEFFCKTFDIENVPRDYAGSGSDNYIGSLRSVIPSTTTAGYASGRFAFPEAMRVIPTVLTYSTDTDGTATYWSRIDADAEIAAVVEETSRKSTMITGTASINIAYRIHVVADARLGV